MCAWLPPMRGSIPPPPLNVRFELCGSSPNPVQRQSGNFAAGDSDSGVRHRQRRGDRRVGDAEVADQHEQSDPRESRRGDKPPSTDHDSQKEDGRDHSISIVARVAGPCALAAAPFRTSCSRVAAKSIGARGPATTPRGGDPSTRAARAATARIPPPYTPARDRTSPLSRSRRIAPRAPTPGRAPASPPPASLS